mgnify:FL=1
MQSRSHHSRTLSRSLRYAVLVVLIFWVSIAGGIGVGGGIFLVDLLPGGPGLSGLLRSTSSNTFEAIGGLIGLIGGLLCGFWLWKTFMLSTGLLSPLQMEELYEDEAVDPKDNQRLGKDDE